jgi:hypothetical protein
MSNTIIKHQHKVYIDQYDNVQIEIREHIVIIKEIRHLLIVLHEYKNDIDIIELALKIGLKKLKRVLNRRRNSVSPF